MNPAIAPPSTQAAAYPPAMSTDLPPASPATPTLQSGQALNSGQRAALQALTAFIDSTERVYLLTGYAGTGKTTLLQAFIHQLQAAGDQRAIALSAFSNKATKVLQTMAAAWDIDIHCHTCCKLLGLRPVINPQTGHQEFQPERNSDRLIDRYQLVIVDECSMINAEMWQLLVAAVSETLYTQTKLLFVGDPAQLPPVNEPESLCFRDIHARSDLTEVVRYGGAISLLANDIRSHLHRERFPRFHTNVNRDRTEGVLVTHRDQWEKLLVRAVTSEKAQANPDQVRALAYTNRRVQSLNQMIRTAIYGGDVPQFVAGERLIANSPCLDNETMLMPTSMECEVKFAAAATSGSWRIWHLDVVTEEDDHRTLRVLHPESQREVNAKLEAYAKEGRWMEFWDLKQFFHDVTYAYSLTIHKSQGSTFQDVFVDVPSMLVNRNVVERNQLAYVAMTRAARRLFLYQ